MQALLPARRSTWMVVRHPWCDVSQRRVTVAKIIPVAIFDCVVFGATGDLTLRKLLPALYYRFRDGQMPHQSRIIGAARSKLSDDDFRQRAAEALAKHVAPADQDADTIRSFLGQLHYVPIDATAPD